MEDLILVVDDAMFMRRIIKKVLNAGGYYNIIEAKDGIEALQMYTRHKPALTLLDITMPGKSGTVVLQEILAEDKDARVVMCSAIGQEETIQKTMGAGARGFVMKPFKNEELLEVVKKTLK